MEVWKDINGYTGLYQVSNLGRVRSLDRRVFNRGNNAYCFKKGIIIKPTKDNGGYLYVGLHDSKSLKTTSVKVHRLVCFAFCEGYEEGLEVNHKNGIRDDNRADNLEWVTRSRNILDRYKRGYNPVGENNNAAKLKNEYLPIIISLYDSGVSQRTIAKAFDVCQVTISNAIQRKHYKEVEI